jgi:hypothetical protein
MNSISKQLQKFITNNMSVEEMLNTNEKELQFLQAIHEDSLIKTITASFKRKENDRKKRTAKPSHQK